MRPKSCHVIEGNSHCGAARWRFDGVPEDATICNCTVCRRYGALWSYGYQDRGIQLHGPTHFYVRGDSIEFHFCPVCGCLAFYRQQRASEDVWCGVTVNLRMAEPDAVSKIPIRHFDELDTFDALPSTGKHVGDYWC